MAECGEEKTVKRPKGLFVWLLISIAAALVGAVMLYPIGDGTPNAAFIIIKAGMVLSVIALLSGRDTAFRWWVGFSCGAMVMTVVKWVGLGYAEPIFVVALITDAVMPLVAWRLMASERS